MSEQYFINAFQKERDGYDRYSTFDFCYNYFYHNQGNLCGKNLQMSCMVLWSYLGSWGMLRGSSALLQKNPAFLIPLIEYINKNPGLYDVDVNNYDKKSKKDLLEVYGEIHKRLKIEDQDKDTDEDKDKNKSKEPSITLITKILMGVYACIPALDRYACSAIWSGKWINKLSENELDKIQETWERISKEFTSVVNANTISFPGEQNQPIKYKNAKLLDMWAFTKGLCIEYYNETSTEKWADGINLEEVCNKIKKGKLPKIK